MSKTRHILFLIGLLSTGLLAQHAYGDGLYAYCCHPVADQIYLLQKLNYTAIILGILFVIGSIRYAIIHSGNRKGGHRKSHRTNHGKGNKRDPRPAKPAYDPAQPPKYRESQLAQSPWWSLSDKTRIFIDTCVLMEAYSDALVDLWFKHLKKNAKSRKWTIVILQSVLKELDGLKNNDDEECAQAARHATNLLSDLQRSLGAQFVITGEYRTPADDEFEREMKKGDILCTRDNNLALRINGHKKLQALGLMDFPRSNQARRQR